MEGSRRLAYAFRRGVRPGCCYCGFRAICQLKSDSSKRQFLSRSVVKTLKGVWPCDIGVASILVSTAPPYIGDNVGLCWGLSSQPTGVDVVANVVVQLFIDCLFNQPANRCLETCGQESVSMPSIGLYLFLLCRVRKERFPSTSL